MLAKISGKIVNWQVQAGILPNEERAVYQYAYELLLNQVINIALAVLIAVVFAAPIPVLLFLISYIPMRSFCGGYHADTNLGCTVVSALMICCVCLIYQNIRGSFWMIYYPFMYLISGYLVIRYAPVPAHEKPLDEAETMRYRRISRIVWLLEAAAGIALYFLQREYGVVIAVSHLFLVCMMMVGKLNLSSKRNQK